MAASVSVRGDDSGPLLADADPPACCAAVLGSFTHPKATWFKVKDTLVLLLLLLLALAAASLSLSPILTFPGTKPAGQYRGDGDMLCVCAWLGVLAPDALCVREREGEWLGDHDPRPRRRVGTGRRDYLRGTG